MELPHVGGHCTLSTCHSLDFLPIHCPFCKQTFCGDHRLPLDHHCTAWKTRDKQVEQCPQCQQLVYKNDTAPEETVAQHISSDCQLYLYPPVSPKVVVIQCAIDHCQELNPRIGPAHCRACDRDFCLKHRYQVKHQCPELDVDVKESRRLAAKEKLAKTFTSPPSSTGNTAKKPKKVNLKVELMKIKAKAKGLTAVPMESRLYLRINFPNDSIFSGQQQPMYLDKFNRVGKTLDMLADYGHVKNENHLLSADHDQRLGLYLMDQNGNTRLLDMSTTLENAVESLDTLVLKRK
ncbi:hypothetical protein BC941DRAFT_431495 [Chlamydoabsidia padenii]|nr:hypothetical protein BC941DRAFT_431495 [Chlamydoabsidia padenii]